MGKIKTYWDEIKDKPTHYYGGNQGWEVHLKLEEYSNYKTNKRTKKLVWCWPFYSGDGVPRSEKALCRKQVLFTRFKEKTLAQASLNVDEYRELWQRLRNIDEEEFKKLVENRKGFELRNYIQQCYLTYGEAHALFWRS